MMSIMLGTIVAFVVGVAGWLVTNFAAKPYLDFRNLRSQVHEEIVFTANVAPIGVENPRYREVAELAAPPRSEGAHNERDRIAPVTLVPFENRI